MKCACNKSHLPEENEDGDKTADNDHPTGLVLDQVEEDDDGAEDVDEDGADREAAEVGLVLPEGDLVFERETFEDGVQHGHDQCQREEEGIRISQHSFLVFSCFSQISLLIFTLKNVIFYFSDLMCF